MADTRPIHDIIRARFGKSQRRCDKDNLPIGLKRTRDMLGLVFRDADLNVGAEIGVKRGEFSKVLCESNPALRLYCVDLWAPATEAQNKYAHRHERYYGIAKARLAPYDVQLIKKASMEAVLDFDDESLDFVYIDAAHDFDHVCPDIIFWSKKVRSGGIVACHDYFHHIQGGVVRAVDAYTQSHRIDPVYVTYELMPTVFWVKP